MIIKDHNQISNSEIVDRMDKCFKKASEKLFETADTIPTHQWNELAIALYKDGYGIVQDDTGE